MVEQLSPQAHPYPPPVRMPLRELADTMRQFHTAGEVFRDRAGPVALTRLGPVMPPLVWVASPAGAHDVLTDQSGRFDKSGNVSVQTRLVAGTSLFTLANDPWRPRRRLLQPLFTKRHVEQFTGHMAAAAQELAAAWPPGGVVDVDAQSRHLTLRVLGRSLFGLDLDQDADEMAGPARTMLDYATTRMLSPVRLPLWVPTPRQRQ